MVLFVDYVTPVVGLLVVVEFNLQNDIDRVKLETRKILTFELASEMEVNIFKGGPITEQGGKHHLK